ncbi:MAG: hypothetical protein J7K00_01150 [Candidatus Diapherotrites archaeon]|nr:hypothetical protein [Candidatus Diapherotrites archaeon]
MFCRKRKTVLRGLSNIISFTLLVFIAVVLVAGIYAWSNNLLTTYTSKLDRESTDTYKSLQSSITLSLPAYARENKPYYAVAYNNGNFGVKKLRATLYKNSGGTETPTILDENHTVATTLNTGKTVLLKFDSYKPKQGDQLVLWSAEYMARQTYKSDIEFVLASGNEQSTPSKTDVDSVDSNKLALSNNSNCVAANTFEWDLGTTEPKIDSIFLDAYLDVNASSTIEIRDQNDVLVETDTVQTQTSAHYTYNISGADTSTPATFKICIKETSGNQLNINYLKPVVIYEQ